MCETWFHMKQSRTGDHESSEVLEELEAESVHEKLRRYI